MDPKVTTLMEATALTAAMTWLANALTPSQVATGVVANTMPELQP
jgi:hypothetical protein